MNTNKSLFIILGSFIGVVFLVGVVGWLVFAHKSTTQVALAQIKNQQTNTNQFGSRFGRGNFTSITGTIVSVTSSSIEVSTSSGKSTVLVLANTRVTKTVSLSASGAITNGATVVVMGTATTDSVLATSVNVLPIIQNNSGFGGRFGARGGFSQNNAVIGSLSNCSGTSSCTLTEQDGSTITVDFDSSTTYTTQQTSSISDITTSESVRIVGSTDSSGNISARSITITTGVTSSTNTDGAI